MVQTGGRLGGEVLDLPARSRFGEGRAQPFEYHRSVGSNDHLGSSAQIHGISEMCAF